MKPSPENYYVERNHFRMRNVLMTSEPSVPGHSRQRHIHSWDGLSMYNLPYHKEHNAAVIREFVDQHPFAFLAGCDSDNRPVATQVPVFIEEKDGKQVLRGHIMKNTDHHKAFLQNENVLVVFSGHHTYVSATWYSNPHMASTWNYMSVHVKGTIRFLDDAAHQKGVP